MYRCDADLAVPDYFRALYDDSFRTMTKELHALGYFKDTPLTLCQPDPEARNMLVDPSRDVEPVRL